MKSVRKQTGVRPLGEAKQTTSSPLGRLLQLILLVRQIVNSLKDDIQRRKSNEESARSTAKLTAGATSKRLYYEHEKSEGRHSNR